MSNVITNPKTDRRIASAERHADRLDDHFGKRQPRPLPRRQRTRAAQINAALKEA